MCDIRNFVFVCVRGVSKIINLCAVCDEILFIWICLCGWCFIWMWWWWCCIVKFLVAICVVSVFIFFCSLWRRWTYKYMLSKIYLAVARMKFLVGGLVLYRYDFLSKLLCGCACVWWCFYADGFLCYKFAKKYQKILRLYIILLYIIICNYELY